MLTKLLHLSLGETFEIESLKDTMRDLVFIRGNDTACTVYGQFRNDVNSPWKTEQNRLASSVPVKVTGVFNKKIIIKDGVISLEGENHEEIPMSSGKRGRKSKFAGVIWPDTEFSFKGLADSLKLPYHRIANAFNKEKHKFNKTKEIPNGGKGRAVTFWKLKN